MFEARFGRVAREQERSPLASLNLLGALSLASDGVLPRLQLNRGDCSQRATQNMPISSAAPFVHGAGRGHRLVLGIGSRCHLARCAFLHFLAIAWHVPLAQHPPARSAAVSDGLAHRFFRTPRSLSCASSMTYAVAWRRVHCDHLQTKALALFKSSALSRSRRPARTPARPPARPHARTHLRACVCVRACVRVRAECTCVPMAVAMV